MNYEPVIGLEIHAQLLTKSKVYCGCSTGYGAAANTRTCPVCLGLPGALPVLNKRAVEFALVMAQATHCEISPVSQFARKNYFYPDLPKGYQISQYEKPLARNGWMAIEVAGQEKRIGVRRIHIEEDAAKSFHEDEGTLVDFNRCGIPLIEIVSEPDLGSPDEAVAYLKKIRNILRYLDICDGNMEEGSLRCDANLSLEAVHKKAVGARAEIKNMNSFRGLYKALDHEIARQKSLLENGKPVLEETRSWDERAGKTCPMREKEDSSDYRYFPDPDLLPLVIDKDWIKRLRAHLPELPDERKARYMREYGLSAYDAGVLVANKDLADYFESAVVGATDAKMVSGWIINELLGQMKTDHRQLSQCPVSPENLSKMIQFIKNGTISGKMAKEIFQEMYQSGRDVQEIVDAGGKQITDREVIVQAVMVILDKNPEQVDQYRSGKGRLMGFFVGQVMKKTEGKANPQLVNEILKEKLGQ